jgi:pimeloyl-ACP methyl ester carboxylesterase
MLDVVVSNLPSKSSKTLAWAVRVVMIWPVMGALPLSVVRFGLAHTYFPKLKNRALDGLALAETLFYVHFKIKVWLLSKRPSVAVSYKYPKIDKQEHLSPQAEFKKHLDGFNRALPKGLSPEDLLQYKKNEIANWFTHGHGSARRIAKFEEIHRVHARQWMAWAFWDTTYENDLGRSEIDPLIEMLEKRIGCEFQDGPEIEDVRPLRLNLDPLRAVHHPILHYVVTHLAATSAAALLFRLRGFEHRVVNGQAFYHRRCRETDEKKCLKPLLFIAGIGIGLISYEKLISALTTDNRDVILMELPEISMRWTFWLEHPHAPPLQTAETISGVVQECMLGRKGAHAVGHSFGTVVMQWLIRLNTAPTPIISSCTMVDPVCFLLVSPSVAANFCYREPSTFLDHLVSYFVAREISVDNALHRHFQWRSNNLDPALLPTNSAVILSELDAFVPSEEVARHLAAERPDIEVVILKGHFHAQFQVIPSSFNKVSTMSKVVDKTLKSTVNLVALAREHASRDDI